MILGVWEAILGVSGGDIPHPRRPWGVRVPPWSRPGRGIRPPRPKMSDFRRFSGKKPPKMGVLGRPPKITPKQEYVRSTAILFWGREVEKSVFDKEVGPGGPDGGIHPGRASGLLPGPPRARIQLRWNPGLSEDFQPRNGVCLRREKTTALAARSYEELS